MSIKRKKQHPDEKLGLDLGKKSDIRLCDFPGCNEEGIHRAPKNRSENPEYYWFCKVHARQYNEQWDFFDDMEAEEIYDFQRKSQTWERPTWPFGQKAQNNAGQDFTDPLNIFKNDAGFDPDFLKKDNAPNSPHNYTIDQMESLQTLGLDERANIQDIKTAYKKLAKQFHPDMNAGNRSHEERFKSITMAYQELSKAFDL